MAFVKVTTRKSCRHYSTSEGTVACFFVQCSIGTRLKLLNPEKSCFLVTSWNGTACRQMAPLEMYWYYVTPVSMVTCAVTGRLQSRAVRVLRCPRLICPLYTMSACWLIPATIDIMTSSLSLTPLVLGSDGWRQSVCQRWNTSSPRQYRLADCA